MPPDARAAEAGSWFSKAKEDLRAAEVDLAARPPLLADAGFHCQQAVEKAMKALLVFDAQPFGKTHDLRALGDRLVARHPELDSLVDDAAPLTEYAWRFRYPGEPFEPERAEIRESLEIARTFVLAAERVTMGDESD